MTTKPIYPKARKRRGKLYVAVGLIMAVVVGGVVYVALRYSEMSTANSVATRDVVVAARDVPARTALTGDDVTIRSVAADATNETAFASVDHVLGRVAAVTLRPGELVTPGTLVSSTAGQAYSILDPGVEYDPEGPDLRAVSVTVADGNAVAGTLVPGQRVDLVATMAIIPEGEATSPPAASPTPEATAPAEGETEEPPATQTAVIAGPSTKIVLQQLTILHRVETIYILRAEVVQAEAIAELQAAGATFTLLLRPEQDDRMAETEGFTIDRLIDQFDFPIPAPARLETSTARD